MLIKVFGNWVNPTHIMRLEESGVDNRVYIRSSDGEVFSIRDYSADDIAAVINKQIKEQLK